MICVHNGYPEVPLAAIVALCGPPIALDAQTHSQAVGLSKRYGFRIYDSLILASAALRLFKPLHRRPAAWAGDGKRDGRQSVPSIPVVLRVLGVDGQRDIQIDSLASAEIQD